MNKLYAAFTIIGTLTILSCKQTNQDKLNLTTDSTFPKLMVKLSSTIGIDENQITKDSNYVINTDYFEISLYSASNGSNFWAEKKIEEPKSLENFKVVTLYIVDKANKPISYTSSTDFLNYISERGYEMKDQQKFKYHTDYTFKRK
jgi:hypothetical protein